MLDERTCYEPHEDEKLVEDEIYAKSSLLVGLKGGDVITETCDKRTRKSRYVLINSIKLFVPIVVNVTKE